MQNFIHKFKIFKLLYILFTETKAAAKAADKPKEEKKDAPPAKVTKAPEKVGPKGKKVSPVQAKIKAIAAKKKVVKGAHGTRVRKIRTTVQFRRPKTLKLMRKPKYPRKSCPRRPR